MNKPAAVELAQVGMAFGSCLALREVSASIPSGCVTGLVGSDAAGKTTLVRLLAGLLRPTQGQILVHSAQLVAPVGAEGQGQGAQPPLSCTAVQAHTLQTAPKEPTYVNAVPQEAAKACAALVEAGHNLSPENIVSTLPNFIGYMPQRFGLYEDLSVMDNLVLHARLRNVQGQQRAEVFAQLLQFTALEPFTTRLAGRLSGGMKQKLGIACALLGSPRLLLLDEPGVGVDPLSRRDLWRMVLRLADSGMTVLWSTAYLDEAERCPHVIMLDEGRVLYEGAPAELTRRAAGKVFALTPASGHKKATLAACMHSEGVADALIQGSRVRVVLHQNPVALPEKGLCLPSVQGVFMPVPPRLEDAYMLGLGGIDRSPSPLVEGSLPASDKPRIEARGLTKRYGNFVAANDISFSVPAGRIFGLLGPNGAGKSTTFRMLCGLSKPSSGECFVDGVNLLTAGNMARARLGYMAQKFSLYTDIPVQENLRIFGQLYGLSGHKLRQRMELLAETLALTSYLRQPTRLLPLGQKQRLALACALLHNPAVLFLDEPTSGVDARTRRDFWKHITAMTRTGVSVLVTTHFMEEAEYCDSMALVYRGNIITTGTPDALKAEVASAENPDPSMEETFIACIQRYDEEHPQ
jgi:ABC-2 type transport system ATP-binding protein